MQGGRRVEIRSQKRLFDDFFKIDEVIVSHQQYDGNMSPDQRRLVFERGDAVAVLLFNVDTRSVVLVEQFKVPSLVGRRRDDPSTTNGWITEVMAGMIGPNETAEESAIRETKEETGYLIKEPELICKFLSSPGGTSERIFLYFAQVSEAAREGTGGGIADEDVRVVSISVNDLFDRLAKGQIDDPKLAIAAYWLQGNMARIEKLEADTVRYAVNGKKDTVIGYKTGSIRDVKDVSIWVNSENTDMMMDRFIGQSISANIRALGANKDEDENIVEDTIQDSLRGLVGDRAHVKIGTVLVTESGMLCRPPHRVRKIFHVATVEGGLGAGVKAHPDHLKTCVEKVLNRVEQENNRVWRLLLKRNLSSILFPMMGAGAGGLSTETVAKMIVPPAIEYLRTSSNPTLKEIYFLAFRLRDKSACDKIFDEACAKGILTRLGTS
jgi:nudix-type nucleoside diphosphatase (YffH/AdpP family)